MTRVIVVLLLVSAASAGQGAGDDPIQADLTQFEAWLALQNPTVEFRPCCEELHWSKYTGAQAPCIDAGLNPCMGDPVNDDLRDRNGLRRDTYYFLGFQFASLGILYLMPESVSSWSKEDKEEYSLAKWRYNVTHPTWDSDEFYINYILHPYWGAAYFVRARERGYSNRGAFWYSALLSSLYEFGIEALAEQASIQDLIVTPVFGSMLGRYFMHVREGIDNRSRERGYRSTKDKWVLVLTDPLGAFNGMLDGWFGLDAELQIRPYMQLDHGAPRTTFGPVEWQDDKVYGLSFSVAW